MTYQKELEATGLKLSQLKKTAQEAASTRTGELVVAVEGHVKEFAKKLTSFPINIISVLRSPEEYKLMCHEIGRLRRKAEAASAMAKEDLERRQQVAKSEAG